MSVGHWGPSQVDCSKLCRRQAGADLLDSRMPATRGTTIADRDIVLTKRHDDATDRNYLYTAQIATFAPLCRSDSEECVRYKR